MDKTITVNSLIQKGIITEALRANFLVAPDACLAALNGLADQNMLKANAEVVKDVPETDVKDALALLKLKKEEDTTAKEKMMEDLKKNSRCKFNESQLKAMDVSALKALSETLGSTPPNFVGGAGGAPHAAPKVNTAGMGMVSVPVMSFEQAQEMVK